MPQKTINSVNNIKWYNKFAYIVVNFTEYIFYNLGYKVAKKPWTTIAICWGVALLSVLGFLRFHQEKNPLKLWVPSKSQFFDDTNWLMNNFQNGFRTQTVIFHAQNILNPFTLNQIYQIDKSIKNTVTSEGLTWNDVCFKIPKADSSMDFLLNFGSSSNKSAFDFDPSTFFDTDTYCGLFNRLDKICFEQNLLQLWDYNEIKIGKLTEHDIVNKVNTNKIDPLLQNLRNYEALLGGIKRNESGHIIGATTLLSSYMVYVNLSAVDMDKTGNTAGTADWASMEALTWEKEFLNNMDNISHYFRNISIYYDAARSFGDISGDSIFRDLDILIIGVGIMVFYVQLVLSKMNCVEAKVLLGCFGLLSVGMAFIVSCGFCSLIGISYGPVHTSLPFLLMGLGVDDMFVIAACWEQLTANENMSLEKKIGCMLKHAGVSITVTTFTDVMAFVIGSSTILPGLGSFCIYAAVGVLMTFLFVVTFFTACFTLDQRRIAENRNGALVCYKHKDYKPNECSRRRISNNVFHFIYSKLLFTIPGKAIVIIIAITCMGFSIASILKLEQRFNPEWFIPQDTYLSKFVAKRTEFYPTMGFEGGLYLGSVNYTQEIPNIKNIVQSLENSTNILGSISSWLDPFRNYIKLNFKKDVYNETISTEEFDMFLSKFLFSPKGARFQVNFKFSNELKCGSPVSNITMSTIDFRFNRLTESKDYIPAMHKTTDIAKQNNFTTGDRFGTSWSKIFATWVTDELIDTEVMRNLGLALLCVMLCTISLVANLQICFWIFVCVLLTMINVCGFMQRWGVTIDVVSCIGLQLAIGLCVDYATHIGHTFLTIQEGTKEERSLKTVTTIGAAVLYGGISTFIGVCMLGFSQAYTFQVFFKIFTLVVVFGMFHGVVLLPVLLCWVGPKPYYTHKLIKQCEEVTEAT